MTTTTTPGGHCPQATSPHPWGSRYSYCLGCSTPQQSPCGAIWQWPPAQPQGQGVQ